MPQLFGKKLRAARQQRGITQAELAEQLGLASHAHIANLESERDVPSLSLAVRASRALQISLDYLLRDSIPVSSAAPPPIETSSTRWVSASLAERLRTLRLERGWGQTELARRLGLARRGSISQFENGSKMPSIEMLLKVCDVFEMAADELLRDTRQL
jgi:transcriptional regulator with XRE-family HTH domain